MQTHTVHSFRWPDVAESQDSLPMEFDALVAHIRRCNGTRSRWFSLQAAGDLAHAFLAPRFVTTLGIAAVGIAVVALLS